MAKITLDQMRQYLSRSITSLNRNKLNGLLAELAFRDHLRSHGFGDRVSVGGWIIRSTEAGNFGHSHAVVFPECIQPGFEYGVIRQAPDPPQGTLIVSNNFHQTGINAYYCSLASMDEIDPVSFRWQAEQLGLPVRSGAAPFPSCLRGFRPRPRRHSFLHYKTNADGIPDLAVPEEFSKEHLRVSIQTALLTQTSDVDGILYGRQMVYPLEIKEKTAGNDRHVGRFFGLDLGPFVKLAFYAAKRGQIQSLFVVREIDDIAERNHVAWWFITFEELAKFASWVPRAGGKAMTGGNSTVVMVPAAEFQRLDANTLAAL